MTPKAKVVNYSPAQESEMVEAYKANPSKSTVEMFSEKFGKSVRSITAKLVRSGVYKKAEAVTKSGEPVELKDAKADAIGAILGFSDGQTASLAKANKTVLDKIFKALANSKPLDA